MKLSFKYVITVLITCLVLVFVWQLFWLKGLFGSIREETHRDMLSCIELAEEAELQHRMNILETLPEQGKEVTISKSVNMSDDTTSTTLQKIISEGDTTTVEHQEKKNPDLTLMKQIMRETILIIHQMIDTIIPNNMIVLDSLINIRFKNKGILSQVYYSEQVDLNMNEIKKTSLCDSLFSKKTELVTYVYDFKNNYAYYIYVEPLERTVLVRMSGILITTGLIIVILGFAFWYLIRTVFRQKTLEEMKDDFTNNMTHELKTPIAIAYSAADALLNFKKGDNKEIRDKYLQINKEQLMNLSGLVEEILSMSMNRYKTLLLKKEDIQLKELLDNLVERHLLKSGKPLSFSLKVADDFTVNADRTHLNNVQQREIGRAHV